MPAVATTAAFGKQNISQAPTPRALECVRPFAYVVRFLPRDDALLPHPRCAAGNAAKGAESGKSSRMILDRERPDEMLNPSFPELLAARGSLHPFEHDGDPPAPKQMLIEVDEIAAQAGDLFTT
jgi:hypothetical protein